MPRADPRNTTRYWWDRHVPGLSLMCADLTTHEFAPHSHDAITIAVTETGGSVIKSRGRTEEAAEGSIFVFNPAEPHSGRMGWSRHWRYRALYLDQHAIDDVNGALGVSALPYFMGNQIADRDLGRSLLSLHAVLETGRDPVLERQALVTAFARLWRHGRERPAPTRRDPPALKRAVDLMHARHAGPLSLDDLAGETGLTVFQLIGLFNKSIGLSPYAFLTQIRVAAACRFLAAGVGLAETASAAGFYDQSAMTRHFKRVHGVTPLQFAIAARRQ